MGIGCCWGCQRSEWVSFLVRRPPPSPPPYLADEGAGPTLNLAMAWSLASA